MHGRGYILPCPNDHTETHYELDGFSKTYLNDICIL